MDPRIDDQQPIARTVGRRVAPPVGMPPTAAARAAWNTMADYLTRAPKGVFRYGSHTDMTRDRDAWTAAAVAERARRRA